MKKRILSILLTLCTVLCLVPAAVLAASDTKEVSSADELTAAAADSTVSTVRLAADIDISASLTVARKVTLDLNGHTLRYQNAAVSGSVIIVSSGAELTVSDSSATTENPAGNGKISGGTGTNRVGPDIGVEGRENLYGGGILIDDGTVNMTAGNITDSKADLGGGVAVMKGGFYMSGGTINNCDSDGSIRVSGGAIVNSSSGTVVLSGSATIRECNGREEGGAIVTFGSFTIRDEVLIEKCYGMQGAESAICNYSSLKVSTKNQYKFKIEGGSIHVKVYLYGDENEKNRVNQPEISGGTFYDLVTVTGEAVISDGTFNGQVENRGGKITGGIFNNTVRNIGDTDFAQSQSGIEGGTFMKKLLMGHEVIAPSPYISGGFFYGGIELDPSADKLGEIRGHTVTYMVDGKEYARQILSGNAVTVEPTDPAEKKYYIFDGWYDGETKFTFGGKVDSDITLTAGWNEIPAFQLRINEETNEWEYSQDHGETWTSFGVKASSGEKGDKGDKGDTGAQGEKGDTGAPGNTPFIGDNGNWWIGNTDTGVSANGNKGDKGDKGDTGAQGEKGDKGTDGKDGVTPILKIGTDNLWYVSYDNGATWTSLGAKATGDKGDTGTDGADGETPYIGDNGNWWIGNTDTGVSANGNKGDKGEKGDTGAQGEKGDTGAPGTDGKDGQDGKDGTTPILKIGTDNLWYVSYDNGATWTSLGVKATGEKGDKGEKGDAGIPGADGKDGQDGKDGKNGKDGVGIAKAEINSNGELVLTYTDGNTVNVGRVVGADGKDGKDGQNASAVNANTDASAKADIHPAIIVIGAIAGVSFLGNLALILYLVLRKKNLPV